MKRTALIVLALVALLIASVAPISAQDDAMMDGVVCDSDLILSLYIAEYYFGYGAVSMAMMSDENMMEGMVSSSQFDKGQYAGLFDSMMGMMDENMMVPGMMSEEQMMGLTNAMAMSDEELMGMMSDSSMGDADMMSTLSPAAIDGEPAECTQLRDQLRHFYTALAYQNMMMMDSSG